MINTKGGAPWKANNFDLSGSEDYFEPGDYGGLPLQKIIDPGCKLFFLMLIIEFAMKKNNWNFIIRHRGFVECLQ